MISIVTAFFRYLLCGLVGGFVVMIIYENWVVPERLAFAAKQQGIRDSVSNEFAEFSKSIDEWVLASWATNNPSLGAPSSKGLGEKCSTLHGSVNFIVENYVHRYCFDSDIKIVRLAYPEANISIDNNVMIISTTEQGVLFNVIIELNNGKSIDATFVTGANQGINAAVTLNKNANTGTCNMRSTNENTYTSIRCSDPDCNDSVCVYQ